MASADVCIAQLNPIGTRMDAGNLVLLQQYIRKDPESYREEYEEQLTHFLELGRLLQIQPVVHRMELKPLIDLTNFLSSISYRYPEKAKLLGENLLTTLSSQAKALDSNLRIALLKGVAALNNRGLVDRSQTLDLLFEMVTCDDKELRKFVYGVFVSFIRKHHRRFRRVDSKMQSFMFGKLKDNRPMVVRIAQLVLIDAFRRGFWRDAKTASSIAECLFHKTPKIQVAALRFFLGSVANEEGDLDTDSEDEESSGKEPKNMKEAMSAFRHAKKTKKRERQLEIVKKTLARQTKAKKKRSSKDCNIAAMRLLFDPQALCDRLFAALEERKNERFTLRLMQMALIARLIGVHQLQTLGFYSYLHKYLMPRQREVARILLYAAQACHELVPSDILQELARCIAQNFITDQNTPEAMTVGLNAIREMFTTCPHAVDTDLLEDLAQYKSYKNKNVSMAARGLINIFRALNPKALTSKFRGRPLELKKRKDESMEVEEDEEEEREEEGEEMESDIEMESADESDEDEDDDDGDGVEDDTGTNGDESMEEEEEDPTATNDDRRLEDELRDRLEKQREGDGLPRLNDIMQFHKKVAKQSKAERIAQIKEGRSDKDSYKKKKKNGPHVGRTNEMMAKRKNFQMVQHKVRGKNRQRSFRDQQRSLRNYLIRQSGRKVK